LAKGHTHALSVAFSILAAYRAANLKAGHLMISKNPFHWLGSAERTLLAISILAASIFWASLAFRPFAGSFILKAIPVASLAVIVWRKKISKQETLLCIALIFHCFGDILLDIDRARLFLHAVGAFLFGHVFYILTFSSNINRAQSLATRKKALLSGIGLYAVIIGVILVPHLPAPLLAPVIVYMLVITTMTFVAFLADYATLWISAGAIFYLLSDSIIAVTTFIHPFAASPYLIWPMYYLGQFLIVIGFLREKAKF
jgi:uncharacterized membrane protein YhhN